MERHAQLGRVSEVSVGGAIEASHAANLRHEHRRGDTQSTALDDKEIYNQRS
eukprot:SAG11_NODE_26193_length_348_cov_1.253012_1_plen_51_part_10